MQIEIRLTEDGSSTFYAPDLDEHYHSTHGAIDEAMHVYIRSGLLAYLKNHTTASIFEMGFGTGLNAYLSAIVAEERQIEISYNAIDNFSIPSEYLAKTNYNLHSPSSIVNITDIQDAPWNKEQLISKHFTLNKILSDITKYKHPRKYDVVYYDAFAPNKQANLWSEELFGQLFENMNTGGILTTYCSKGIVRRMLQDIGFKVERIAGPKGKREILRATK